MTANGKCEARRVNGEPCGMRPLRGKRTCFQHSEETRAARTAARHKGGVNRRRPRSDAPPANLKSLDSSITELERLLDSLRRGEEDTNRVRAMTQIITAALGALSDHGIEERLRKLEET